MDFGRRLILRHCSLLALVATVAVAMPVRAAPAPHKIVVLGDSLSAEYGLARGQGWAALLNQRLLEQHRPYEVLNASISGETSAGGKARLPALLQAQHPAIVIVELGGNDMLRGLPLSDSRANLQAIVAASQAAGAKVLLVGMQVPPNYGSRYVGDFTAMYTHLAQQRHCALLPFLLKGVADQPDVDAWFQADRIHPLARAHPIILENVWGVLHGLL